jgi:hypothetical protein
MKRHLFALVVMANLCFAAAAMPVRAQSADKLVVRVPFAFNIGKQAFPAGEYTLKRGQAILSPDTWTIEGEGSHAMLLANPGGDSGASDPKLVFNRYGDMHFLSAISGPSGRDYRLPTSHAERQARRNAANETVAVVAK